LETPAHEEIIDTIAENSQLDNDNDGNSLMNNDEVHFTED